MGRRTRSQRDELLRQTWLLVVQQGRLLNMRLAERVDQDTFSAEQTRMRHALAAVELRLGVWTAGTTNGAVPAFKVFEHSQTSQ